MRDQADRARTCGALILGGYVGEVPTVSFLDRLAAGRIGGAILFRRNLPSVQSGYDSARAILARAPAGQPPWISVDQEGGRVRRLLSPVLQLPSMRSLASAGDAALVARCAGVLGRQLLDLGFNVNFAPVLDVDTNPANPVIGDRSFGREPGVVGEMGTAFALGLQGAGVVACGKHFPGHGDTAVDSHLALPRVDSTMGRLHDVELAPFRAAIQAGIDAVMSAHIVCPAIEPEVPATLSHQAITTLLRAQLGFEGVVFSDDLEMKAIAERYTLGAAAVAAVRAGCDVVCICKSEAWQEEAHAALVKECERDAAFLARCTQAAERGLRLRQARPPRPARSWAQALSSCETNVAQALARELDELCASPT